MKEHWTRWEPSQHLSKKYEVSELILKNQSTVIVLYNDDLVVDHTIHMTFTNLYSFWRKDESYAMGRLIDVENTHEEGFLCFWTFFEITHSPYLAMTFGSIEDDISPLFKLKHFCIVASNDFIDIISPEYPTIQVNKIAQYTQ